MGVRFLGQLPQRIKRIVVVGDLHGDLQRFRHILRLAKLVHLGEDSNGLKDQWAAAADVALIQLGDVIGRGPDDEALLN